MYKQWNRDKFLHLNTYELYMLSSFALVIRLRSRKLARCQCCPRCPSLCLTSCKWLPVHLCYCWVPRNRNRSCSLASKFTSDKVVEMKCMRKEDGGEQSLGDAWAVGKTLLIPQWFSNQPRLITLWTWERLILQIPHVSTSSRDGVWPGVSRMVIFQTNSFWLPLH